MAAYVQANSAKTKQDLELAAKEKLKRQLEATATEEESRDLCQEELAATLQVQVAAGYEQARLSRLAEMLEALERTEARKQTDQHRQEAELLLWTGKARTTIAALTEELASDQARLAAAQAAHDAQVAALHKELALHVTNKAKCEQTLASEKQTRESDARNTLLQDRNRDTTKPGNQETSQTEAKKGNKKGKKKK